MCIAAADLQWLSGLGLTVVGGLGLLVGLFNVWRGIRTYRFIEVEGEVLEFSLTQDGDGDIVDVTVKYRYKFAGCEYIGRRFSIGSLSTPSFQQLTRNWTSEFKNPVTVYVDATSPQKAVLVRGVSAIGIIIMIFMAVCVLFGIMMMAGLGEVSSGDL